MSEEPESRCLYLLPFGVPTLVIAEDPQLLAAATATYAYWRSEAPFADPTLEVRLEAGSASSSGVCLDIKVEGSRLELAAEGAAGTADAASGKAHALVATSLAKDAHAFGEIMDMLLLFLLARSGRTPIHASAFVLGDRVVLLAGRSGSGKSTLALAAAQRGHKVLSDDMVFVEREPKLAVWGFPRPIHVFPEDAPPGKHATRLRNGKRKAAVAIRATASKAKEPMLVILERGIELSLSRIEAAAAVEALMMLEPGFDLIPEESRAAADALASHGAWRLTLNEDPRAAIDFLASRLAAA